MNYVYFLTNCKVWQKGGMQHMTFENLPNMWPVFIFRCACYILNTCICNVGHAGGPRTVLASIELYVRRQGGPGTEP